MAGSFAIVLDKPVCAGAKERVILLEEFEDFCADSGLESAYYRVEENSLQLFNEIGKKSLIIGQEVVIDLQNFTLEGREKNPCAID